MSEKAFAGQWGLVLGSSSGFGEACALELAARGMSIFGVHFDRAGAMAHVNEVVDKIKAKGADCVFFNVNAADDEKRAEVIAEMKKRTQKPLRTLIHSLAFGTLKRYIDPEPKNMLGRRHMEMTLDVMAHSLVYWVQDLFAAGLIGKNSRVYGMTSEGDQRVWATYGAVSAAKAALESHLRQLAYELAPHGVTCNAVRAGVTVTPALEKIPGSKEMVEVATRKNPNRRTTKPEDVARAIAVFCLDDTYWMTGNVLGVDGGEFIAG